MKGTDQPPPTDKWHLVFLTCLFHGLGTLIAWNMFITAKDYFVKFKLANTVYAQNFLAYMGWASQIPNLVFNWINVFANFGGSLTTRIVVSVNIELCIFIVTIVLAMVNTTKCPALFFWLTMISVFFLNGFNAIFQNSIFGVAARLPPKYMGAVVLGSNCCGILVVFLSWLSTFFKNLRTSAIYYFLCGLFVLAGCLDSYVALPINRFYRYCTRHLYEGPTVPGARQSVPYMLIFRQTWTQLYNVCITFFVTLSVFPAVISDINPIQEGFLGHNFVLITCFLTFSVMAMIGNVTASIWQIPNKKLLIVFTTVRLVFIPLFLLCNYQVPGRTLSVMINSDLMFWFLSAILGWSSGHGSSLAMMYVSGEVAPEHAAKAGMIGGAMLMTGLMSGIIFTRLAPIIVSLSCWAS